MNGEALYIAVSVVYIVGWGVILAAKFIADLKRRRHGSRQAAERTASGAGAVAGHNTVYVSPFYTFPGLGAIPRPVTGTGAGGVSPLANQASAQSLYNQIAGVPPIGAPYPPPPQPDIEKALLAGPIVAWRLWRALPDGTLMSVAHHVQWPSGRPLEGDGVEGGGTCGVYALKQRDRVDATGYVDFTASLVAGQVALWGKVIEHEHGFRAQYAYPVMIDLSMPLSPEPMPGFPRPAKLLALAQAIRDRYGCEVRE